jgi:Notch-like protein
MEEGEHTMVDCFSCTCAPGWSGFTCEKDENECATDAASKSDLGLYNTPTNICNENALCTNLPGTYACACNLGWTGTAVSEAKGEESKEDQTGCWDANDCEFNPCAHGGTCTDCGTLCMVCECVPGWRGTTCGVDWNECLMGIHRCNNDATCVNTPGSYACKCDVGFTGDGIGQSTEEVKIKFKVNGVEKTKTVIHGCQDIDDCIYDPDYILFPKRMKTIQEKVADTCLAKNADDKATCEAIKAISYKQACKANDKCTYNLEGTVGKECEAKDKTVVDDVAACTTNMKETTLKEACAKEDKCKYTAPTTKPVTKVEGHGPCIHATACNEGSGPLSYSCDCRPGWQDTNCDSNENECLSEVACHRFAECVDTEGSYECTCKKGYQGDGKNCVDENDCKGQCKHGFCTDLGIGDFKCNCDRGWEDKLCDSDINECSEFTHGCGDNAICTNAYALVTLGPEMKKVVGDAAWEESQKGTADGKGYSCKCDQGFEGAAYKPGKCTDIDDCKKLKPCKNGTCKDTGADAYVCTCNKGWQDFNCDYDINECFIGTHHCVAEARCVNTPGTYNCRCLSGYGGDGFKHGHSKTKGERLNVITGLSEKSDKGYGCHDLNDCVPEPCDTAHGKCVDRGANKYECVCQDGWGCNPNPKEKTCATDCDECAEGFGYPAKNSCAKGGRSTCTNNPDGEGGYMCKCNYPENVSPGNPNGKGWYGDGETCTACTICDPGYWPRGDCKKEDRTCKNKDECKLRIDNCDKNAICEDSEGSFSCECKQEGAPTKMWVGIGKADEWFGNGIQETCNRCTRCYPGYREVSPCTSTTDRVCTSYVPSGIYMMESEADDNTECIRLDPKKWYPTRFDAGNGAGFCGLKGGKKAVAKDPTLTWRFTQLNVNEQLWKRFEPDQVNAVPAEHLQTSDLYTIESKASDNEWKCLFFGDKGMDMYPSLQNCKDGETDCPWNRFGKPNCGFVDRASLIRNRQAIWKVSPIKFTERKYIVQNRKPETVNGAEAWDCLVFEHNGAATNPSRYNWGNGGDFCGVGDWEGLGKHVALMTNKQAIFILSSLA